MIDLTKYIQRNLVDIGTDIEFLLRNPEVTIKDDVEVVAYSNFYKSGKIFARFIQEAMDMDFSEKEKMRDKNDRISKAISTEKSYDIALSFASEDRKYASKLANSLVSIGIEVFYDEFENAELWGKDLYTHLSSVYKDKAKFCVVFISKHYANKAWTTHELRNAQARAFNEQREYILPIRIDNTEISGINSTVSYVEIEKYSIEQISHMLQLKLKNV